MPTNKSKVPAIPAKLREMDPDKHHAQCWDGDHQHFEQNGLPYEATPPYPVKKDWVYDPEKPYLDNLKVLTGFIDSPEAPPKAPDMDPDKCQYIKADGEQCKKYPVDGHEYCYAHLKIANKQDQEPETEPAPKKPKEK